jgi:hypothetical protein
MSEAYALPTPLLIALEHLRQQGRDPRVDAVDGNFAYIWIPDLQKPTAEQSPGGWIRLPTSFPYGNPHGLVTIDPLKREADALVSEGHHPRHDMCKPVCALGGANYYSWTWLGCPELRVSEDIVGVVQWYERRARKG